MDNINTKWKNWVVKSLLAGSDPNQIAHTLNEQGFCAAVIERWLGSNLTSYRGFRRPTALYHSLYQPKLLTSESEFLAQPLCDSQALQLYSVNGFLSHDECDEIVAIAKQKLKPSEVAGAVSSEGIRTSTTCDLAFIDDKRVVTLNRRIVDMLALGIGEQEVIQAQHYAQGEYYKPHYDFFPPGTPQFTEHCQTRGQRTWTCMIYLNDNFEQGHTRFTKLGLSVKPLKGMALIWNNLLKNGEPNPNSIHFAEPVKNGSKVVVTKWFRDI